MTKHAHSNGTTTTTTTNGTSHTENGTMTTATTNDPNTGATAPINKIPTPVAGPKLPPSDLNIPVPPVGYVPTDGSEYRGTLPRPQQMAVMGEAIQELERFADYTQVLGRGAPPLTTMSQAFAAGYQWSLARSRTKLWAQYCLEQEGLAWKSIRAYLDRFQPNFELAIQAEPDLASHYPNLVKLCGALRGVAAKAVSTKRANAKAKANGEEPFKGKVGKRRKRAAEAAAYEQLTTTATPAAPAEVAKPPAVTASAPPVQPVVVSVGAPSPTHA